jgi:hypothetical protein
VKNKNMIINKMNNHIAIFIHCALLSGYENRLNQYIDIIKKSGLYDICTDIFIDYVGEIDITEINNADKITQNRVSNNLSDYETPTLNHLYYFCKSHSTYKVLYLHTKNVGKMINSCIEDQINYMLYFNIKNYKICLKELDNGYVTVGVDLRKDPVLHYSGNFWWANANYIKTLPEPFYFQNLEKFPNPLNSMRHNQEFWICYYTLNNHYSLWDCQINCYERHLHNYDKILYENKIMIANDNKMS